MYTCTVCDKLFKTIKGLKIHTSIVHKDNNDNINNINNNVHVDNNDNVHDDCNMNVYVVENNDDLTFPVA